MRKVYLKKAGASFVSLLLALTLFPLNAQTAFATDPVKGVEVHADSSKLEASVGAAKAAGVDVQKEADVDKGSTETTAETDAKKAEIQADYDKQIKDLDDAAKEAKKQLADYATKKAAYDTAKAKYDTDKAKYDTDMVAYNKAMEELEKKKNQDGYMTKPYSQSLIFKSEPHATSQVDGKVYSSEEWLDELEAMGYSFGGDIYTAVERHDYYATDEGAHRVYLKKDQPLRITYTNLQNSYFNGKKISKVEYTYTLKKTTAPGQDKIPAILYYDPTVTINYSDLGYQAEVELEAKFYDDKGDPIDVSGGLFSLSSLNRDFDGSDDKVEYIRNFSGELVNISGSSIAAGADGSAMSTIPSNEYKEHGSDYDFSQWDTDIAPNKWYGAIVGKAAGPTAKVTFGAKQRKAIWFAFNSDIKALDVPTKPVEPTPPTEPQKPVIKATYHYDILYVKPVPEKKALDENNNDINTNTVKTGSVVKFELSTTPFPAGHEKITSVVFRDTLPEGYEINLKDTKNASPDYDVTYDEGTRTLVFTGKTSLLSQINADLTKEAKVPAPIVVGKVTKDGASYENDFDIDINNTYSRKSNKVTVKTPEPPNPPKKKKNVLPYTGDAGVLPSIALLTTSAIALGGAWIARKKQ